MRRINPPRTARSLMRRSQPFPSSEIYHRGKGGHQGGPHPRRLEGQPAKIAQKDRDASCPMHIVQPRPMARRLAVYQATGPTVLIHPAASDLHSHAADLRGFRPRRAIVWPPKPTAARPVSYSRTAWRRHVSSARPSQPQAQCSASSTRGRIAKNKGQW